MTRIKKTFLIVGALLYTHSYGDLAKIEVVVVDAENDRPVEGIEVVASFSNDNGWKVWTESAPINHDRKLTDHHGRCHLSGKTNNGNVGFWIESSQKGYYGIGTGMKLKMKRRNLFGIWQPDNLVTTVKVQRVVSPIPLFVKNVNIDGDRDVVDRFGRSFQYDLVTGDWLPPLGNGKRADLSFERLPRKKLGPAELPGRPAIRGDAFRDEIRVTFTGEGNGIVEMFTLPTDGIRVRMAPAKGFENSYVLWHERDTTMKYRNGSDKNKCLCFRIRTTRDENGNVTSSYYGKIYGDIILKQGYGYVVGGTEFLYYLNPTPNDRNLEWDMKHNLCPNPGDIGQPQP